jgi:glutamyl-tRNA reductase
LVVDGTRDDPAAGLLMVGVNHRSAAARLRDLLFVEPGDQPALLAQIREAGVSEALVLSTCDRVEVLAAADDPEAAAGRLLDLLAGRAGLPASALDGQTSHVEGREAAAHLFAVAASLESQVIGEPQVLGQVKDSHRIAGAAGMTGPRLEAALQAAYAAAKRVRNETTIAEQPSTVAASALQVARRIHGDLKRTSAALLGLGEMGELLADELHGAGVANLAILHESLRRAEAAAHRLGCHYRAWDELPQALAEADIVVAASGSGRYTVEAAGAEAALKRRRRRPIFFIDAAVPGDVDPAVAELDGAFVYDLADLEAVALEGRASREATVAEARRILDRELAAFLRGRAERAAVPAVAALRGRFETVRDEVLHTPGLDAAEATRRLVNQLLHGPSEALRRAAAEGGETAAGLEKALGALFGEAASAGPGEDDEDEEDKQA